MWMPNLLTRITSITSIIIATLATSSISLAFTPNRSRTIGNNVPSLFVVATVINTRDGGEGGGGGGGDNDDERSSIHVNREDGSTPSTNSNDDDGPSSKLKSLLAQAQQYLNHKNAEGAFGTLAQAYVLDPTSPKISAMFESCLGLKVELAEGRYYQWKNDYLNYSNDGNGVVSVSEKELNELFQDRMGLSSLFIDREYYDEAGEQLRKAIEEATFWLNRSLLQNNDDDNVDFSSTRFHHWQPLIDRAQYLLYRTDAACCQWDTYFENGDRLRKSLQLHDDDDASGAVARMLHPFDALKFPCISLELASDIARTYATRALESVGCAVPVVLVEGDDIVSRKPKRVRSRERITVNRQHQQTPCPRKIRIGYISPDFTSKHPLAFLMQHVFRHHDKSQFVVNIYSVSSSSNQEDDGPEVRAIREGSDTFTYLSPSSMTPGEMYQTMLDDELDVLVDLCGYAGTSAMAEIMASRARLLRRPEDGQNNDDHRRRRRRFPMHVSYMGFPGSVGSTKVWDYSVFDPIVIPSDVRDHYDEALVYMPHCYFVNSHRTVMGATTIGDGGIGVIGDGGNGVTTVATRAEEEENDRASLRAKYGIHPSAFVYCCHSRPDKIDPSTFRSWMRALARVRASKCQAGTVAAAAEVVPPVLWLLRSGEEMERNLRRWVRREFGDDAGDCLVFADVAERSEHLRRLGIIADVFLDTPAYNAHTLGCDALYMGVPMISLLRPLEETDSRDTADSKLELEFAADVDSSNNARPPGDAQHEESSRFIATEKLASRVGASLLAAIGLGLEDDLVHPDMDRYEDGMVRCALDEDWFADVRRRLVSSRDSSPLFDTERWVRNLEAAFRAMAEVGGLDSDGSGVDELPDIRVSDHD